MKPVWKLIGTQMGWALECSECKHKISIKQYAFADQPISTCPFCEKEMDLSSIDEDEIQELLKGAF